ncbi:hypothetical protein NUW58_g8875 [Xylaria curta]|uniref:Uncharacterized protein n=1 Tax=Xylaria curta TaxID=42375 RepID=A0ACC1N5E4_9PEZI|nr:hypothetical protein NUW58_g8875 [Xylaria curta]
MAWHGTLARLLRNTRVHLSEKFELTYSLAFAEEASRPIGTLYAGNLLYVFDQHERILNATRDFILYNADPKAAVLMNYNVLTTPDLDFGLDQACVMFLVYDGEDPGDAFANFTAIPHLLNTLGKKTYIEVANLLLPKLAILSRADNVFRIGVHRADDDSYLTAFNRFYQWAQDNKFDYTYIHMDYNPVPRSLTDASKAQGGNAMEMPDGPWFWAEYTLTTPPLISARKYNQIQASFKAMVDNTPNAAGLPFFLNEAHADQDALKTFSSYTRLQQIKRKYDPDGFFTDKTGGPPVSGLCSFGLTEFCENRIMPRGIRTRSYTTVQAVERALQDGSVRPLPDDIAVLIFAKSLLQFGDNEWATCVWLTKQMQMPCRDGQCRTLTLSESLASLLFPSSQFDELKKQSPPNLDVLGRLRVGFFEAEPLVALKAIVLGNTGKFSLRPKVRELALRIMDAAIHTGPDLDSPEVINAAKSGAKRDSDLQADFDVAVVFVMTPGAVHNLRNCDEIAQISGAFKV